MALKEKLIDKAQKLIAKGQYDKAVAEYRAAADADPRDISVRLRIGDLYVKMGKKPEAIKEYTEAARANAQRGFYLKAIAVYKQTLKLDDSLEVHNKLAELYTKQRLIADAISEYSCIVAWFERKGKTSEVLDLLKKMVEVDPDNMGVRLKLAELYQRLSFEKDSLTEYYFIFDRLLAQGKLEKAEKIYLGLYAAYPADERVITGLSDLYKAKGDSILQVRYLKALLEICRNSDRTDDAKRTALLIEEIKPNDPDALSFLKKFRKEEAKERPAEKAAAPEPLKEAAAEPGPTEEAALISWPEEEIEVSVEGFAEGAAKAAEEIIAEAPVEAQAKTPREARVLPKEGPLPEPGKTAALPPAKEAAAPAEGEIEISLEDLMKGDLPSAAPVPEEEAEAAEVEASAGPVIEEAPEIEIEIEVEAPEAAPVEVSAEAPAAEAEPVIERVEAEEAPSMEMVAEAPVPDEVAVETYAEAEPVEEAIEEIPQALEEPVTSAEEGPGALEEAPEIAAIEEIEEAPEAAEVFASATAPEEASMQESVEEPVFEFVKTEPVEVEADLIRIPAREVGELEAAASPDDGIEAPAVQTASPEGEQAEAPLIEEVLPSPDELIPEEAATEPVETEEFQEDISSAIDELMEKIEPQEASRHAGAVDDGTEEYVDLSAELGMKEAGADLAEPWGGNEPRETFDEFKTGIETQLNREDSETHYNLGIAYMEMELFSEASKEFKIALKDPRLEFDCYSRLNHCAMSLGEAQEAVTYCLKGIKVEGRSIEERIGMMYELGLAYEAAGETEDAEELFAAIHELAPTFREVAAKVESSIHHHGAPFVPLDDGLIEVELL